MCNAGLVLQAEARWRIRCDKSSFDAETTSRTGSFSADAFKARICTAAEDLHIDIVELCCIAEQAAVLAKDRYYRVVLPIQLLRLLLRRVCHNECVRTSTRPAAGAAMRCSTWHGAVLRLLRACCSRLALMSTPRQGNAAEVINRGTCNKNCYASALCATLFVFLSHEVVAGRAGNTSLMIAAAYGHKSTVRLLLAEFHANANERNMYGTAGKCLT